ncbi:MAG: hypothetical protein M1828_004362 [Chrysothrix sp. TS-e1954]|nr:MAG: hypothetical protein M1828_004362 [Chrysothrix sp. TS-e1954]
MASTPDNDYFSKVPRRTPDEQAQREADAARRLREQDAKAQARQVELVSQNNRAAVLDKNSTLPATISSITVLGANHTRRSFLARIFSPLLSANNSTTHTLSETLQAVGSAAQQLNKLDIYQTPISTYIDRPDQSLASTTPTDLSVFLSVRETPRFRLSSGTWAGSNDGSVYGDVLLRNLFGGAESAFLNYSRGTRTRWSAAGGFDTPILSNPDLRFEVSGIANSVRKDWASHEEVNRGGHAKLKFLTSPSTRHELSCSGQWRQITNLAAKASQTVRNDAGDSFKTSFLHTFIRDTRSHPLLPLSGTFFKSNLELAGLGPLGGDVSFAKLELESQAAHTLHERSGISMTAGLRGGVLYPLPLGNDLSTPPRQSRINDRFTLGGPSDVRGFRYAGMGPRDGSDAVGGDVYAAGGASILFPFPRAGKDTPLRLQLFLNGGRLVSLQDQRPASQTSSGENGSNNYPMSNRDTRDSVLSAIKDLGNGEYPSCAAGVGVVYAMDVARFEVNFSLPLVIRKGEEARKGIGLGIGISFL